MLKRFRVVLSLLLILGFSATLIAEERIDIHFPHTLGSYWVYEDQDGNRLTRRTVAEKTIEGETYHAFSYEPSLEDWADYEYCVHPNFYQIRKDGIVFFVGDEVEKTFEARLRRDMDADSKKQQGISTTLESVQILVIQLRLKRRTISIFFRTLLFLIKSGQPCRSADP